MQEKALSNVVLFQESAAQKKVPQAEDLAQKAAAQYFGKEILSWLEIPEEVRAMAPTENVKMELRHTYEDFNFIMQNGMWYHFEFESGKVTVATLRRFREYEATTSKVHGVDVVTYVICSGAGQKLLEELNTGISTYRVKMILLKDHCVETVFEEFQKKEAQGKEVIGNRDLIPVAICPLLGGEMPMKERVLSGFRILQRPYPAVSQENLYCLQAILYVLAAKFLTEAEMNEIKEGINMTYLGQLIFDDGVKTGIERGIKQGMEQGLERGILTLILDNLESGMTKEVIFSKLQKHFELGAEKAEVYWEKAKNRIAAQ